MAKLFLLLLLFLPSASAQAFYAGGGLALTTFADEETPFVHAQAGAVQGSLDMRVTFTTNAALSGRYASYVGVDLLYTFPFLDDAARGYLGGGGGVVRAFSGGRFALSSVLGGEYRTGRLGVFAEAGALILLPFPFPQARAGVNVYF